MFVVLLWTVDISTGNNWLASITVTNMIKVVIIYGFRYNKQLGL